LSSNSDAKIEKFVLPSEQEKGAEKILNLAGQPLLLLMLALYDSQGNQLRTSKGLDRTKLYDSLLRRFVIRERGKEKGFNDGKTKEREKALTIEMQRLGVAALGMYNRRKVHILSAELDDDLAFFKLEREVAVKSGKTLSQADLLLGSFFFVHKSKAQHSSGAEDTHEESSAFEFLHNTFGEFLTADFIIRRAVAQVQALRAAEANEALRSMIDKMMGTADGFERDWFASLVYTPLFTRPVILEMIREWAPQVLKDYSLSEDEFVETLDKIVLNQTKRLLSKREMPQIMRKETAQEGYRVPFGDHPLVGHIAIYSINLILLRLVAGKAPFDFDESEIASHEDGTRPWDRLMHIWRSWFSLGNLNGLTAVMLADRSGSKIRVTAKSKFQAEETKGRLQEFYNVALALGDDVSACIAGFHLFDPTTESFESLLKLEEMVHSEGLDLGISASLMKLLVIANHHDESSSAFVEHSIHTLDQAIRFGRSDQIEVVCQVIARKLERNIFRRHQRIKRNGVFRDIFKPPFAVHLAMRDPRSARIVFGLGKRLHDSEWVYEFSRRFLDSFLHEMLTFEVLGSGLGSKDFSEWVQLLREIGGEKGLSRYVRHVDIHPKFLEQMLDPRHLLELSNHDPEGMLSYLQILLELGGGRFLEELSGRRIEPEFLDSMLNPHYLLELSEHNPQGALAYLQILRELGGGRYFKEFYGRRIEPEFLDRMLNPHYLLELSEHNPEGALSYLQILRELGGGHYFEEFYGRHTKQEFLDRMLDPRHLLELSEHNPEVALSYLQILRELGGGRYFEELSDRRMEPEFLDQIFDFGKLLNLHTLKINSLGVWLAFARLLNSKSTIKRLGEAIRELLIRRPSFKARLLELPIASLSDLRWLAKQSEIAELCSIVDELIK
jgi:hypothetical protein